jgi:hypothetical protein
MYRFACTQEEALFKYRLQQIPDIIAEKEFHR